MGLLVLALADREALLTGLSVVKGEVLVPVFDCVPISLEKLEGMSEGIGLPGSFVENPFGFVPLHAVEHLLHLIHGRVGDPTFLFQTLSLSQKESASRHTVANVPLPTGQTGFEAIQGFTSSCNASISVTRFHSEVDNDRLWILRTTGATEWSDVWPVRQYNLSFILTGVRRLFGDQISPVAMLLNGNEQTNRFPGDLSGLPVEYSHDNFGLAFALDDIVSNDFKRLELTPSSGDLEAAGMEGATVAAIADFMSKLITSTDRLSERAAKAFGMTTRSYRRHLASLGTSHASILADIRLRIALQLLSEPDASLSHISGELGYAFPGDFTRFFFKRTGLTPSAYRKYVLSRDA